MLAMYLAVLDDRSSEEQFIDVYNTYKRLYVLKYDKLMNDKDFQQLFRREAGAPLGGVAGGGHGFPGAGIDFQDLGQIRAGRSTKHTVPPSLSVPGRSPHTASFLS